MKEQNVTKEKAEMHIGKNGFTKTVLADLLQRVYKKKEIKIKVLNTFEGDRKEIGVDIANRLGLEFVQAKGNTIVFRKKELPQRGKQFKNPKVKEFPENAPKKGKKSVKQAKKGKKLFRERKK